MLGKERVTAQILLILLMPSGLCVLAVEWELGQKTFGSSRFLAWLHLEWLHILKLSTFISVPWESPLMCRCKVGHPPLFVNQLSCTLHLRNTCGLTILITRENIVCKKIYYCLEDWKKQLKNPTDSVMEGLGILVFCIKNSRELYDTLKLLQICPIC